MDYKRVCVASLLPSRLLQNGLIGCFGVSGSVLSVRGIADVSAGAGAEPSQVSLQPYRAAWAISFGNRTRL